MRSAFVLAALALQICIDCSFCFRASPLAFRSGSFLSRERGSGSFLSSCKAQIDPETRGLATFFGSDKGRLVVSRQDFVKLMSQMAILAGSAQASFFLLPHTSRLLDAKCDQDRSSR
jgi:hypothetical protein